MTKSGPSLIFMNEDGKPRLTIHCNDEGSSILLTASDIGNDVALMAHTEETSLAFYQEGKPQLSLVQSRDISGLSTSDRAGTPRIALVLDESETPLLLVSDNHGKQRISLALSDSGSPMFSLHDPSGTDRAILMTSSQGEPALFLRDKNSRDRVRLDLFEGGTPSFTLHSKDGDETYSAR